MGTWMPQLSQMSPPLFGTQMPYGQPNYFNMNMGGAGGALLGIAGQGVAESLFSSAGLLPGQFAPVQSYYDLHRAQQEHRERTLAMQRASETDRYTYMQALRGVAEISGTPWNASTISAANTISQDMASLSPFFAQIAPATFDAMHGRGGSATVLTQGIFNAGRTRMDPSGGFGMRGETASGMATQIFEDQFARGRDLRGWNGMGAGQAGMLFQELEQRGMMPSQIGAFSRDRQIDMLASAGRYGSADDIRRTISERPEDMDMMLQHFDAKKITDRLKSLSGAVSAMRDIFGDLGRSDAPMTEIINGLNALTQGGLANMPTQQVEQIVRRTHSLSRQTGMGIDAIMALTTRGANMADQLGMERSFAVDATQNAAAFGGAFGQVGGADLAAYGRRDRDNLTLADQELRMRAANSQIANQMGAALRLAEESNLTGPALDYVEALKRGDKTFGNGQSVQMSDQQWQELMGQGGVGGGAAGTLLRDRFTNQEYVQKHGVGNLARELQRTADIKPMVQDTYGSGLLSVLRDAGMDRGEANKISQAASGAIADALFKLSPEERTNAAKRNQAMEKAIADSLTAQGMDPAEVQRLQRDGLLTQASMAGWGNMEERIRTDDRFKHFESGQKLLDLNNEDVFNQQREQMKQADIDAQHRKATSGLGRSGLVKRVAEALLDPEKDLGKAVGKIMGGIDPAAIKSTDAMAQSTMVDSLNETKREISSIDSQLATVKDPEQRRKLQDRKIQLLGLQSAIINGGEEADNIIKGTKGLTYAALSAASNEGLKDMLDRAGAKTGVQVDQAQISAAATDVGGRNVDLGLGLTGELLKSTLGNKADLEALGAGGLKAATDTESTYGAIKDLERSSGKKLSELIASKDPKAIELQKKLQGQLQGLDKMRSESGKLGADEQAKIKEHIADRSLSFDDRRKDLLGDLGERFGIDRATAEGAIGSMAGLSQEEQEGVIRKLRSTQLSSSAGKIDPGHIGSQAAMSEAIAEAMTPEQRRRHEEASGGGDGNIKITGRVKVDLDKGELVFTDTGGSRVGHTA